MMLGTTTLSGATFTRIEPSARQVIHQYDWSDESVVTDMGSGPTMITVAGLSPNETDRKTIIAACEAARVAETKLLFPSENGAADDRYYRVFAGPCRPGPATATVYRYEFQAIAIVPYIYDATTDDRVT